MSLFPYFNAGVNNRRRSSNGPFWVMGVGLLIVLAVVSFMVAGGYSKHHTITTTVDSKERVCSSSGSSSGCKYLVFTDHGTYKITDSLFLGTTRFNSSDVYGRIHECDRYKIEYYGWRLPFFSSYPNIATATDLGPVAGCRPS